MRKADPQARQQKILQRAPRAAFALASGVFYQQSRLIKQQNIHTASSHFL
jgi:hypothetical protein